MGELTISMAVFNILFFLAEGKSTATASFSCLRETSDTRNIKKWLEGKQLWLVWRGFSAACLEWSPSESKTELWFWQWLIAKGLIESINRLISRWFLFWGDCAPKLVRDHYGALASVWTTSISMSPSDRFQAIVKWLADIRCWPLVTWYLSAWLYTPIGRPDRVPYIVGLS